jgi:hypothetical protein
MIAYGLYGNVPALDRVTRLAVRAKLPTVNISMAICAFLANVGEHQLDMASGARNLFMHSAERIPRLIVFKFRDAANRLPTQGCMAVLARDSQPRPVRIPSDLLLRRTVRSLSMKLKGDEKYRGPE